MSTTTIDDQLAGIRRRVARLEALAQTGLLAERARIKRHLDALLQEEASVLAAERRAAPDEVEEKLGQLRTRLAVAENSVIADVSEEWTMFAAAVEDELRSWDTYLERLQATAVAKAGSRERAEAAIADVRTRRIAVYDRLAQAREDVNGTWHEQRNKVSAARDELEQKADELSARIK